MPKKEKRSVRATAFDPLPEDFEEQLERKIKEKVHLKLANDMCCRDNAVMTRLTDEDLRHLDALVELEVFKSRSEAVAYFVREGMKARKDLFDTIMPTVDEIQRLKEKARASLDRAPPDHTDEEGSED
jgi:Arc/MetJ-type ribon-helix-helix transcriptional regulator